MTTRTMTLLLRCNDLAETRRFYADALGFVVCDSAEGTLTAQRFGARLIFTEADLWAAAPAFSGTIYLSVPDLDGACAQVAAKLPLAWGPEVMSYGSREFAVVDCNGYHLAFSQAADVGAPALILIDMQRGMASAEAGARNNPGAEAVIADLLRAWRAARAPVVHVRHISRTPGSPFWPGQSGVEFQPALAPLADEHVVEKNVPDAFVQTGLERWLRVRGIARVVLVGVSTNNSVEATARSCGNLGFTTHVVADATFAFARQDFDGVQRTAQEVHAMALANLHGECATVMTAAQLLPALGLADPLRELP